MQDSDSIDIVRQVWASHNGDSVINLSKTMESLHSWGH